MFKRCGALVRVSVVLGLAVLSSSTVMAQGHCRSRGGPLVNGLPIQQQAYGGVSGGAYYDARSGGRFVAPNYGVYNAAGAYSNQNVQVYQDQLHQTAQVQAYQAYNNPYGNAYGNGYSNGYGGGYTNGYNNQITVSPYQVNQPGYVAVTPVGVNPWNGYTSNAYNGYTYPTTIVNNGFQQNGFQQNVFQQNAFQQQRNCRPRGGNNGALNRFWVSR